MGWFLVRRKRSFSIVCFSPNDPRIQYFKEPVDPRAICLVSLKNQTPLATLTIQKKGDLGVIGHYEAKNQKTGIQLLKKAEEELQKLGVKEIIGPMNGNTWHRYRLAIEDANTFFLGEPKNPASYHDHFIKAGFQIREKYESRILTDLLQRKDAYFRLGAKMAKLGIIVGSLNMDRFESVLKEIYEISLPAFQENRFYEPISFEEFSSLYLKMKPFLNPDFIQLAYDKKRHLIGYAFAYEDANDPSRVIFKTLAASQNIRAAGLGVYLYDRIHWIAEQKGKKAVIHALMHEEHNSTKLSKATGSLLFRSYALYGSKNLQYEKTDSEFNGAQRFLCLCRAASKHCCFGSTCCSH